MTRTPPTMEQLKAHAHKVLEESRRQLQAGKFVPVIGLDDALDGTENCLIVIHPETFSSKAAKNDLARRVRGMIAKHGYSIALSVGDCYAMEHTSEKEEAAVIALSRSYSLKEIHECFGLGKLIEMLMADVQTVDPSQSFMLRQVYTRNPDRSIAKFEEPEYLDNFVAGGRFQFFNDAAAASQA